MTVPPIGGSCNYCDRSGKEGMVRVDLEIVANEVNEVVIKGLAVPSSRVAKWSRIITPFAERGIELAQKLLSTIDLISFSD